MMEMSLLARMSSNQSPTAYPLSLQFFQDVHAAQIRYGACEFVATEIAAYKISTGKLDPSAYPIWSFGFTLYDRVNLTYFSSQSNFQYCQGAILKDHDFLDPCSIQKMDHIITATTKSR